MHRGFNLTLKKTTFPEGSYEAGLQLHAEQKERVQEKIDGFKTDDGKVNASKMQANWFPQIRADLFISHSRADQELAITLAGWLKTSMNLVSFIDSCAWGYANDLLRLVDREYCYDPEKKLYDYELRNQSTSHVHMMLSTALAGMIDKSECVFFLNTPSSITPGEVIGEASKNTKSPWIYSEIAMTQLIRQKSSSEHRAVKKMARVDALLEKMEKSMDFVFGVSLDHLTELDLDDLRSWYDNKGSYEHALDALYDLK